MKKIKKALILPILQEKDTGAFSAHANRYTNDLWNKEEYIFQQCTLLSIGSCYDSCYTDSTHTNATIVLRRIKEQLSPPFHIKMLSPSG